jgi:hypothetical protein
MMRERQMPDLLRGGSGSVLVRFDGDDLVELAVLL